MKKDVSKKTGTMIPLLVVLSLALVIYLAVALYFTGHFLFNTYVNEIYAFNMTASEIEKEVSSGLDDYRLSISARGGITEVITAKEIGLRLLSGDQFVVALREQNPFLWPSYLFKDTYITTETIVSYPEDVVKKRVEEMPVFDKDMIKEPVDAYISDEVGENGFYIVPEDPGTAPKEEKVLSSICDALDVLDTDLVLPDDCYEEAEIKEGDPQLIELCNNLNKFCTARITYEFGDDTVVVDGTQIKNMCNISGTEVNLDPTLVREFVNSIARKYDSFGKNRTLTTHSGETIEITGGDYGWWMDRSTETKELCDAIINGDKVTRTPVYFGKAAVYGDNDWGENYVEINLTEQHLWVYVDGMVAEESDFVSGCVNKSTPTPTGTYGITYKERDATLVGENYSSPVKYWMPFNGNVGMHDASWRSEFGGELYITSGSHGCINLPVDKAASIFDLISKGEAVLVYGGETVPRIPEQVPGENIDETPEGGLEGTQQIIPQDDGLVAPEAIETLPGSAEEVPLEEGQEAAAQNGSETNPEINPETGTGE